MLEDFIVIDNVISTTYQNEVELFLHEKQPWWFQSDITFSDSHLKDLERAGITVEKRFGWGSMIYDPAKSYGSPNSLVTPILYNAIDIAKISFNEITLIRGFMSAPFYKEQQIDKPHVDRPGLHYVCLYYVNDSDGDTVIFKRMTDSRFENQLNPDLDPNELEVLTTVSPKKGRCVLFDGRHYHASTRPTQDIRTVINFNFV